MYMRSNNNMLKTNIHVIDKNHKKEIMRNLLNSIEAQSEDESLQLLKNVINADIASNEFKINDFTITKEMFHDLCTSNRLLYRPNLNKSRKTIINALFTKLIPDYSNNQPKIQLITNICSNNSCYAQ